MKILSLFIILFFSFLTNTAFAYQPLPPVKQKNLPLLQGPSGYLLRLNSLKHGGAPLNDLRKLDILTWEGPVTPPSPKKSAAAVCSLADMLALPTPAALVQYLQTQDYDCLSFLWNYDPAMIALYNRANVTAVFNAIASAATAYDGTDNNHLLELIFFIRVGYYQNYYEGGFSDLEAMRLQLVPPLTNFFQNAHAFDNGNVPGSIISQAINSVSSAELDNEMYETAYVKTLVGMLNNISARFAYGKQSYALYDTEHAIWRSTPHMINFIPASMFNILETYAELYQLYPNNGWVMNNALSILTNTSTVDQYTDIAHRHLINAYNTIPPYTVPWTWAAESLFWFIPCVTLDNGQPFCYVDVQKQFKDHLFDKKYSYENGQIVFNVNSSMPESDVLPLYYATKEVKAQFGRIIGGLTPVAQDTHPTVNFYIFALRSDYKDFLKFIFDVSRYAYDNEGKYSEKNATYYTFQRDTSQSIFSIQEMVRNGYSRYLVGRYLAPGTNPVDPLYANGRTVFYDEGLAEFLVGSTLTKDVQMRTHVVNEIKRDGIYVLQLSEIVSANYWNDMTFQRYAAMFFHFLYTQHLELFQQLNNLIAKGDGANFDNLIFDLIFDYNLNAQYQAYLTAAISKLSTIITPVSIAPLPANLIYTAPSQIQSILANSNIVSNTVCNVLANQTNNVFGCQGQITGPAMGTQNTLAAWYTINSLLDRFQTSVLQAGQVTNLNWMSCRFNAIQWSTSGASYVPSSSFTCEGPLGS